MSEQTKPEKTPHEKFTAALASVLAVSPEKSRDTLAQAKAEKPLPHKRWKYDPAKAES